MIAPDANKKTAKMERSDLVKSINVALERLGTDRTADIMEPGVIVESIEAPELGPRGERYHVGLGPPNDDLGAVLRALQRHSTRPRSG